MDKNDKNILIFPSLEKTCFNMQSIDDKNLILLNKFFDSIEEEIKNKNELIILDMQNLISLNSYILAKLLYYQKKAKKYGCKIKIINLNENFKKIIINLNFGNFFIIE